MSSKLGHWVARDFPALFTMLTGALAAGLWAGVVVKQWPRLMAAGTLCAERHGLAAHCAACYPAAALTLAALGGGTVMWLGAKARGRLAARPAIGGLLRV